MRLALVFFAVSFFASMSVHASEKLPDYFKKYQWLEDGVSFMQAKNLELAPTTSCKKLNAMFAEDELTALQKKREWKAYDDRLIPLTGVVQEVDSIPLTDDFLAIFKCVGSHSFVSDFTVRIPAHKEEAAYRMSVGQKFKVYVRLKGYSSRSGIETEMDYGVLPVGDDRCLPTLLKIKRSNGEIMYMCEDPLFIIRKLDFDMDEGKTKPVYMVDFRETDDATQNVASFVKLPFLGGESIFSYMRSKLSDSAIHLPSFGDCVLGKTQNLKKDIETAMSELSAEDKKLVADLGGSNLTNREAVRKYFEIKEHFDPSNNDYSCQARHAGILTALKKLIIQRLVADN